MCFRAIIFLRAHAARAIRFCAHAARATRFCANIKDMQKGIRNLAFILAIILIFSPSVAATEHRELSDDEIGAVSQNCASIKVRLQRVQKDDARNRVFLGSQYEMIASKLMLNLNLRLVKNSIASATLADQQTTFTSERDRFKNDFIGYSQEFENLLNINCKNEPEKFYRQLEVVREKRADVDASMQRLKSIVSLHYESVLDLRNNL